MSTLKDVSYWEMRAFAADGTPVYVSGFPSPKTTPGAGVPIGYVFDRKSLTLEALADYTDGVLAANNFPWHDFLGRLLPPKAVSKVLPNGEKLYNAATVIEHLSALFYASAPEGSTTNANHTVAYIGSELAPDLKIKVHVTAQPAPQEAIDVIPISNQDPPRILLARRAVPPASVANLYFDHPGSSEDDVDEWVRVAVRADFVTLGEHLEDTEKAGMENVYAIWEASGRAVQPMASRSTVKAMTRTMLEEGGLHIPEDMQLDVRRFLVGASTHGGRDLRYWINTSPYTGETYGYKRDSIAYTAVAIIPRLTVRDLDKPTDTYEIKEGVLITVDDAIKEFRIGGKYPPVFPAHVEQLASALKVLPDIKDSILATPRSSSNP